MTTNSTRIDLDWDDGRNPRALILALEEFEKVLFDDELPRAAEDIGLRILADAKRMVHVDTGRLRASLDHEIEEIGAHAIKIIVGSNVEYADDQERMYPYLRPAIRKNEDYIQHRWETALRNAEAAVS